MALLLLLIAGLFLPLYPLSALPNWLLQFGGVGANELVVLLPIGISWLGLDHRLIQAPSWWERRPTAKSARSRRGAAPT